MANIGGKNVSTNDLIVLGAGGVMLIDSFLPWYGISFKGFGIDVSSNIKGWSSGFWAWAGILLVLVAAGIVAARVFGGVKVPDAGPLTPAVSVLLLAGLGAALVIIRLLTESNLTKFGLYLGIVAGLGAAYGAFMSFKDSGEKLPDFGNMGHGGGAPSGGGTPAV